MNDTSKQPDDSQTPPKDSLPSYWPGLGFLIAAVVANIIGRAIAGSIANSVSGQFSYGVIDAANRATRTRGSFDILMVVLGIIGIILLVRAFLARSKASKS
jgi:uncharacterized membrane protein